MTEYGFWSLTITLLQLAGRALYEKERDATGNVIGLWPLRPDWVKIVSKNNLEVEYYEFGPPGLKPIRFAPENILEFSHNNPLNPLEVIAPANVAERVYKVDQSITNFVELFFAKGGMPPGLLKTKQKLLESQVHSLRARWREKYGGYENWLDPAVLDSDAEFQRIGLTFNEMGFVDLDRRDEIRICMVFRVPPIIVGASVGLERSTYENYGQARRAWWQETLLPMFKMFKDDVALQLFPEYGTSNVYLDWDTSGVFALQADADLLWRRSADALRAGGITINMYLDEIGKPGIGPTGDVFLRPLNAIEVPLGSSMLEQLQEQTFVDEDNSGEIDTDVAPPEDEEPDGEEESEVASSDPPSKTRTKKIPPPDRALRNIYEQNLQAIMSDFFAGQQKRIIEAVRDGESLLGQ
jgi:HK97 family phage portal protein